MAAPAAALSKRLGTVENALRNATALAYTQRLETRISALETALNIQSPPPSAPEAAAPSAAEDAALTPSTPSGKGNTSPTKNSLTGLRLVDIRFSVRPEYPFYVGISPGVVSTAGDVYLSVQAGYDGLIGPLGPVTRLTFNGGNRELRFSADVLAKAELLRNELRVYGGLGLGGTVRPEGDSLLLEGTLRRRVRRYAPRRAVCSAHHLVRLRTGQQHRRGTLERYQFSFLSCRIQLQPPLSGRLFCFLVLHVAANS